MMGYLSPRSTVMGNSELITTIIVIIILIIHVARHVELVFRLHNDMILLNLKCQSSIDDDRGTCAPFQKTSGVRVFECRARLTMDRISCCTHVRTCACSPPANNGPEPKTIGHAFRTDFGATDYGSIL
jgi:hypothetical protein